METLKLSEMMVTLAREGNRGDGGKSVDSRIVRKIK